MLRKSPADRKVKNERRASTKRRTATPTKSRAKETVDLDHRLEEAGNLQNPQDDIEARVLHEERLEQLKTAISSLPTKERIATELYVLEGYSSSEAAEIMTRNGIPCTSMHVRNWARDSLRPWFPKAMTQSFTEIEASRERAQKTQTEINRLKKKTQAVLKKIA